MTIDLHQELPPLPEPDCECGQSFNPMYCAETVRQLLADNEARIRADERRRVLAEIKAVSVYRGKWHVYGIDEDGTDGGTELFDADVNCDECTPVLLIPEAILAKELKS